MHVVKAYAAAIIGNKELYRRNSPIDETRYVGTLSAGTSQNLPTSLPKGAFRRTWLNDFQNFITTENTKRAGATG